MKVQKRKIKPIDFFMFIGTALIFTGLWNIDISSSAMVLSSHLDMTLNMIGFSGIQDPYFTYHVGIAEVMFGWFFFIMREYWKD